MQTHILGWHSKIIHENETHLIVTYAPLCLESGKLYTIFELYLKSIIELQQPLLLNLITQYILFH